MKNFWYIPALAALLTACTASRHTSQAPSVIVREEGPVFLEHINIRPQDEAPVAHRSRAAAPVVNATAAHHAGMTAEIERCRELQFKFAILMDRPVETLTNERLLRFLDGWYGTPYRYGGNGRNGIDCSAFTAMLMDSVYRIPLPRTARSQYASGVRVSRSQLRIGDLVFFNTRGGISHVGFYLGNDKFVHASSSQGVTISDLNEEYFRKRYAGSARIM